MRRVWAVLIVLALAGSASAHPTLLNAITPDSEPGWRPTEDLTSEIVQKYGTVLHEIGEGSYEQAYWDYDPEFRALIPEKDFVKESKEATEELGRRTSTEPVFLTWTKPRPGGALSGLYLAMDFTATYEKARRTCGYVVMHQRSDDANWYVLRTETYYMLDASFDKLVGQGRKEAADNLWAATKRKCPNVK